ncbi:MAG: hypothetical protein JWO72_938 [Caulobacteraceae bacterium]|jgi:hypothetical protein|nr:hypothetical protein [Caulobacteraceae bacterium]
MTDGPLHRYSVHDIDRRHVRLLDESSLEAAAATYVVHFALAAEPKLTVIVHDLDPTSSTGSGSVCTPAIPRPAPDAPAKGGP